MVAPVTTVITAQTGSNLAAATFNGTSTDCRTFVSIRMFGTITNGATAPTLPAQATLQVSEDNATFYVVATATASLTNNGVTTFDFFRLYPGAYVRVQITGNTVQAVTYAITGNTVTGLV